MGDTSSEDEGIPGVLKLRAADPAATNALPPQTLRELRDRLRSTEPATLTALLGRAGAQRLRAGRFTVQDLIVGAVQLGADPIALLAIGPLDVPQSSR